MILPMLAQTLEAQVDQEPDFQEPDYYEPNYPVEETFNVYQFQENLSYVRSVMKADNQDERSFVALSNNKLDKTLHGFLQTDFMIQYKELKMEAESIVSAFKAEAMKMKPSEVARVRKAYTVVADQFNMQLVELKRDFLDKKKMKLIRHDRDMYANSLQYKLRALKDVFSNDFEQVIVEVTGSAEYSAIPLAAILGLIKLAQDVTEYFINASYEAKKVNEEHLNRYLVEPYRFRDWIEIDMVEGDIYNFQSENMDENYQNEEYVEENNEEMNPFMDDDVPVSLSPRKGIRSSVR